MTGAGPAAGVQGMVALVTGGSRGIGRAVAEEFAAQGATVVVQFRADGRAADDTLARLGAGGHRAAQADLADPGQARSLVARVVDELGRVDVLVNNAGIYEAQPILACDLSSSGMLGRPSTEVGRCGGGLGPSGGPCGPGRLLAGLPGGLLDRRVAGGRPAAAALGPPGGAPCGFRRGRRGAQPYQKSRKPAADPHR
jgi:hypothetical protein